MKAGVFFLSLFLLVGCEYSGTTFAPKLPTANPLRATFFDFDTGDKIAETVFEYNDKGKVLSETHTVAVNQNNYENHQYVYEYDAEGNLIKKRNIYSNFEAVNFYSYNNGLLVTDSLSYTTGHYESLHYFYGSDNLADSLQRFQPHFESDKLYLGTSIFHYDLLRRLILETFTAHDKYGEATIYQYKYNGNNQVKSCREGICTLMEYNADGQVTRSTLDLGAYKRVMEDNTYTDKVLTEKVQYLYGTYDTTDKFTGRVRIVYTY